MTSDDPEEETVETYKERQERRYIESLHDPLFELED